MIYQKSSSSLENVPRSYFHGFVDVVDVVDVVVLVVVSEAVLKEDFISFPMKKDI